MEDHHTMLQAYSGEKVIPTSYSVLNATVPLPCAVAPVSTAPLLKLAISNHFTTLGAYTAQHMCIGVNRLDFVVEPAYASLYTSRLH